MTMRKIRLVALLLIGLAAAGVSACAPGGGDSASRGPERDDTDPTPYGSSGPRIHWDNSLNRTKTYSMHNNTRMVMNKDTARAIAGLAGVDSAWVLLTEKNAYVAVRLPNGPNLRDTRDIDDVLKNRIAAKVKELHPKIRNVFVSADPDFAERLRGYSEKVEKGEPIRGLILEFNRAVERLFPNRIEPDGRLNGHLHH